MKTFLAIVGVILLLVLFIVSVGYQQDSDIQAIQTWANAQGYTVVDIERCHFDLGPYWAMGKHSRIYRADVNNKRYYFHFWWGSDFDCREYHD